MFEAAQGFYLKILETAEEMAQVEQLQRIVWPGNETGIVPNHMLLTAAHNGGLVIGVYPKHEAASGAAGSDALLGFVFGFPGLYKHNELQKVKHCSHMLGVLPGSRDQGVGFALKRAQWQMVRNQGLDLITWTYDPLLSRNAYLNIARLGAVCNTYQRDAYGELRDGLNSGLATDRFQVDWWVATGRVELKLSKKPRRQLDLAHFISAGADILNPTSLGAHNLPRPGRDYDPLFAPLDGDDTPILLFEIPADFQALKAVDFRLAQAWRAHSRDWLEGLFALGFMVTDFIFLSGANPRSFYVLSYGDHQI